jgi:Fic family protein
VRDLLENLEKYLGVEDEPPLIKLALAHYQFETIHPYRDGNGRLGRLLISLWLQRERILTEPMLYLSAYFERRQTEYYDRLLRVSTHNAWLDWTMFFLEGGRDSVDRRCCAHATPGRPARPLSPDSDRTARYAEPPPSRGRTLSSRCNVDPDGA